jgi:hypothetical protein
MSCLVVHCLPLLPTIVACRVSQILKLLIPTAQQSEPINNNPLLGMGVTRKKQPLFIRRTLPDAKAWSVTAGRSARRLPRR